MAKDDIAGAKSSGIIGTVFLMPGKVIQWVTYMSVGNTKGYGAVRQQTRLSRSPIMTYVYAFFAWIGILLITLQLMGILDIHFE